MGAFKDKIIKELIDNKQYDLADVIDKIEDDVDVANYLSSGRGYYTKMYTTPDLEAMPEFRNALYSDLKTGEVDLNKEFGEDWYKNYEQIPSDQIKFVADKQGIAYDKLVKAMSEEATKQRRYDIAHDGTAAGVITKFVAPRAVEAVERGESPSGKDVVLDVAENVAYAAPWATAFRPFARLGNVGRIAQGTAGNALTPAIMETADAIAYDDSNPRGNFSPTDVASQTAVNATTPLVLRSLLRGAGRFVNNNKLADKFDNFATTDRTTRSDMPRIIYKERADEVNKAVEYEIGKLMPQTTSFRQAAANLDYAAAKETNELRQSILAKLDLHFNGLPNGRKYPLLFTDNELALISKDPVLSKYIDADKGFVNLPTNESLAKEEAIKNYLTNQFGSYWYDEQSPWTRIPVAGQAINKYFKDKEESAKRKATESRILDTLRAKYGDLR